MSINPYLDRLRGQVHEKQHPPQPSKPSKPCFESFEGDQGCHFSADERSGSPKNTIPAYPQNHRNLGSPAPLVEPSAAYRATSAEADGATCKVTIVEIPAKGLRYRRTFAHLQLKPPPHIPEDRWRQCITDGRAFLHRWGETAQRLGWDSRDLFGLHTPPAKPHPNYNRLSRYDATGLIWLLQGRRVTALTAETAAIENPATGSIMVFRKNNRPALGPLGDNLDDFA
jgi:hypothetical protein